MAAALSVSSGKRECKYGLLWLVIAVFIAKNTGGKYLLLLFIIINLPNYFISSLKRILPSNSWFLTYYCASKNRLVAQMWDQMSDVLRAQLQYI